MITETTMMADCDGRELFVGDVVRADVDEAFRENGVHGDWADYQIVKAPGGYAISYLRSQKGTVLPYGYLCCFMVEFNSKELPDMKRIMFAKEPITHPSLRWVDDQSTTEQRMRAFEIESKARWDARQASARK